MTNNPPPNSTLSTARRWGVLAICASALFLVGLDTTIVTVALPSIGSGLEVNAGRLSWIVDAYTVTFASMLITSGALADRFGRRRVFATGLVVFALASLLCALAPSIEALIAARVVQGVGASMLSPVALAIVVNLMTDPRERALAIGVWGSMFGLSMAAGPVTGGALIAAFDWRAVFLVNLPLVGVALVLVAIFVPESRARRPRHPDLPGQILLVLILASGVGLLIEGPHGGWTSPTSLSALLVLAVGVPSFVVVESRRREPLVEPGLFGSLPFTGAVSSAVAIFTAFSMTLFLTTMLLQEVKGWTAVAAGAATVPMALGAVVSSPLSGYLVGRSGGRTPLLFSGICVMGGGLVLIAAPSSGTAVIVLAFVVIGTGVGLSSSPITTTAVNSLPADRAGVAGGITSTARQVGTALGAAIAGGVSPASPTGWLIIGACGAFVAIMAIAIAIRS